MGGNEFSMVVFGFHQQNKYRMLKTIDNGHANPERRIIATAFAMSRPKKGEKILLPEQSSGQWGLESFIRPHTTPLIRRGINQTLNSTGRSSNLVHLRSISVVEDQLNHRYKQQMNPYLIKKFRKFIRKNEENVLNNNLDNTATLNELQVTGRSSARRPLDQFYSTLNNQSKLMVEKGVEEAYLVTAKERIVRLIERKKEREDQYKSLNVKIKKQRVVNEEGKTKNRLEEYKKQTIEEEEWDRSWRQEVSRQSNRYRNRLLIRTQKKTNPLYGFLH